MFKDWSRETLTIGFNFKPIKLYITAHKRQELIQSTYKKTFIELLVNNKMSEYFFICPNRTKQIALNSLKKTTLPDRNVSTIAGQVYLRNHWMRNTRTN